MHGQGEFFADADHDITEDQGTAVGVHLDGHDVLVLHAEFRGIRGGHVDVALRGDHAFSDFHFTGRADQLAGAGAGDVTGFTYGRGDADGTGIRQGKLHLGRGTDGPEDTDALQRVLGADHIDLLLAGELAGLGQPALDRQLMAGAEEGFEIFFCHMYVTGGGFNQNLIHERVPLPLIITGSPGRPACCRDGNRRNRLYTQQFII